MISLEFILMILAMFAMYLIGAAIGYKWGFKRGARKQRIKFYNTPEFKNKTWNQL